MTRYGYHASHEQYPPGELLSLVQRAGAAGFDGVLASDHFHPWLEENGHSGFVWSWLGAALHATPSTDFGTVCATGDRYHPAIIAQAAATLAEMFPGRFWVALASGEAVNEHVTGNPWPSKEERRERLRECAEVVRALWAGETVTHHGRVVVEDARLYSRPRTPPLQIAAAVSEESAEWAGGWADGVITTGRPREEMVAFIEAFHRGGGAGKPVFVQHALSWAPRVEDARREAWEQWRFAPLGGPELWDLRTPADFARATRDVTPDEVAKSVRVSADLDEHAAWLGAYRELRVERVYCFNVGRNQREFIDAFGERVLPQLRPSG